ncbi:MAG TPA: hypothetical protein VGX92_17660 [Pyrinomonadaceae bacterium]|jgi:hypothetical protein|nr:hypothetical protein [Pyrinomonadaceae bacterium]
MYERLRSGRPNAFDIFKEAYREQFPVSDTDAYEGARRRGPATTASSDSEVASRASLASDVPVCGVSLDTSLLIELDESLFAELNWL